jgi:transposase
MSIQREEVRRRAIKRYLAGEKASSIAASLGYTERWFYKWLQRYREGSEEWYRNRPRRPHSSPLEISETVEELVKSVRESLHERGLFYGAQAIRWELEDLRVEPLPSIRTIGRILARHDLVRRRRGPYEPKGKRYPQLEASKASDVHQSDFVGPRYLQGPIRFYSLNSVDLATRRCAVEPTLQRQAQTAINAFWASWIRLGIPRHQQVDNEGVFLGSPRYPRGMGSLIRLCLLHGVQVWFIPPAEPWRNGIVEKFNDHWQDRFLRRITMSTEEELRRESLRFEDRHNRTYRYSALGGKTPLATLAGSSALRFPANEQAPKHPLAKPETGRYHLIRFIRSDGMLDILGEKFAAPPEAHHEYVRASVDVAQQRLSLYLDGQKIDDYPYRMR